MVDAIMDSMKLLRNKDRYIVPEDKIPSFVEKLHRQFEHDGDRGIKALRLGGFDSMVIDAYRDVVNNCPLCEKFRER